MMKRIVLLLMAASFSASLASSASIVVYNNIDAWANALLGCADQGAGCSYYGTETFSSSTPSIPGLGWETTNGRVQGGVWADEVTTTTTTAFDLAIGFPFRTPTGWGGDFLLDAAGPGLLVTFSWRGADVGSATITNTGSNIFWGAVSDTPFDRVVLASIGPNAQIYQLDNMVFNPEPGTYAMLGSGLLGLFYARRRLRKQAK